MGETESNENSSQQVQMSDQEYHQTAAMNSVGREKLDPHIHDDRGDPHRAALDDINPNDKVTLSTWAAVFFIASTYQSSITCTILLVFPILIPIALQLEGNTNNVNWMASGWSLAGAVAFAIAGQLSDYFGRRNVILLGQILLIAGHIIGATAQSVNQVISAMVILGFGTGTSFVAYVGISELLPVKYRSIGLAATELELLPFSTFGPLIARSMVQNATWRWVFYLGIITGVFSCVGTLIFYNPPSRPFRDRTYRQILRELDYLGIFFYTSGLTLFLLGLGWAGIEYPWNSAAVIVPIILGAFLFICTFIWDFSGKPLRPLFPYRLFKMGREYSFLLVIIFVVGLVYISVTALIPEQLGYMYTDDAIRAGLYNIPAGFGGSIGGAVLGGLIWKIKYVHWQLVVACIVQTVFTGLLAIVTPDTLATTMVFGFFANVPFGWILINCYVTAGIHVPQRDIGLAFGWIGAIRFVGGAVGTTVFSTILNNKSQSTVLHRVIEAVVPLGYPAAQAGNLVAAMSSGNTSLIDGIPRDVITAASTAVKWGYSDAFRLTFLASIPFGVIATVLAFFVRDPSPYFTSHISVTLEKERLDGRAKTQTVDKSIDIGP